MTLASQRSRSAPSIPGTVWLLGFVSMLMDISSEMVQTLLPLYLVSGLGASAAMVGLIEGLSVAVATVTKFFSGAFSDLTRNRKHLATFGYGLAALSKPLIPLADSLTMVAGAKFLDRVGKGIRGAPRDALIADVTPPEIRGASFGLRKSLDTVGGFVGPLVAIGLMLLTGGSFTTVFWIAVIPAFLAVFLLAAAVREPKAAEEGKRKTGPSLKDIALLTPAIWLVVAVASVLTLARFSEAFLLLRAGDVGFSIAWIPITMVVMHLVYGLAAYPVGILSDRVGRRGLLAVSLVFLVAADLLLATTDSIGLFLVAIVLWGLHMGFSQGILATLVADTAPANLRGSAFGLFNLTTGAAVVVANLAAGLLWDGYGAAATFVMGAIVSTAALLALPLLPRSYRSVPHA
nr:MFS transporter [Ensifer adhaerens]